MSVSVLISVYEGEQPRYLNEALTSLVEQTQKPDEVVLIEDGPISEGLREVIKQFKDKLEIVSVRLNANVGLGPALNIGLESCSYDLIARMDSDDIALPHRLEKQVEFMNANPDVSVSSAWVAEFDPRHEDLFIKCVPIDHESILSFSQWRNPLNHPVTIFRKSCVIEVGGYPNVFPEDYALWSLMIVKGFKFSNIPEVLLNMRADRSFVYRRGAKFFIGEVGLIRFQKNIGFLTLWEAVANLFIRASLRLPPASVRRFLYKIGRKEVVQSGI